MRLIHIPDGLEVRQTDSYGSGIFGARRTRYGNQKQRRSYPHLGTDFVVVPGKPFPSFSAGFLLRHKKPYPDDLSWDGALVIAPQGIELTYFYLKPHEELVGDFLSVGEEIGVAQDIRLRYPADATHAKACTPHAHVQVTISRDFMRPKEWEAGKDYILYSGKVYANVQSLALVEF